MSASEVPPLVEWWIGPSREATCPWCGKAIGTTPEYVVTEDEPGQRQWWHATCRDRALSQVLLPDDV